MQVLWGCSERWSWLGEGGRNRGLMEKELSQEMDTARHLMARARGASSRKLVLGFPLSTELRVVTRV